MALHDDHLGQYEALRRMMLAGASVLVECKDKQTGDYVAVIAIASLRSDGSISMEPVAKLFNGDAKAEVEPVKVGIDPDPEEEPKQAEPEPEKPKEPDPAIKKVEAADDLPADIRDFIGRFHRGEVTDAKGIIAGLQRIIDEGVVDRMPEGIRLTAQDMLRDGICTAKE